MGNTWSNMYFLFTSHGPTTWNYILLKDTEGNNCKYHTTGWYWSSCLLFPCKGERRRPQPHLEYNFSGLSSCILLHFHLKAPLSSPHSFLKQCERWVRDVHVTNQCAKIKKWWIIWWGGVCESQELTQWCISWGMWTAMRCQISDGDKLITKCELSYCF